jgi:hypothetical protein
MSQAVLERIEAQSAPPINRSWPKRYMSRGEAADYTGIAASTLNNLQTAGKGPLFSRIGGRVIYALEDLDAWIASFKVDPANKPAPQEGKRGRGRPWPPKKQVSKNGLPTLRQIEEDYQSENTVAPVTEKRRVERPHKDAVAGKGAK